MLKVFILAFISIQLVQSTSFEQTRDCLHGPEFWCKSVQNSRYCGAFKHCLDTVWSKHHKYLINAEQDHSCDSCLECLHGDTKKCPNVDLNLDEIAELFMASIPSQTICKLVDGCKNNQQISTNVEEERFNLNDCAKLHPRTWCDSIENARKCNSIDYCRENIWSKLRPMILDDQFSKSDAPCGFCIWVFNKLHEILQQNLTEFNMKEYLLGACSLLPNKDDENKCTDTINKNFDEVYNLIRNSMDPGIICRVLKLCNDAHLTEKSTSNKIDIKILNPDDVIVTSPLKAQKEHLLGDKSEVLVSKLTKTGGVACEICTLVVNAAKILLENGKEEEEVLNFIKKELCNRLGTLNDTCVEYVNTMGKEIMDALAKNIDPSIICHQAGLCLSIQITSSSTKRFFDINVKDDGNCTLCKLVMTEVKTMLANKKSEEELLDFIRKSLCEKSGQYSDMCKTVVTAYGPLILEFLANDIRPDQICQLIGMCHKKTEDSNPTCVLCEFVLSTLANFIGQNSSSTEVEKWLEYSCELLPSTIRDECKHFVEEYEPVIVALISNEISPDKICQFIGVCKKSDDFKVENYEEIKNKLNLIQIKRVEDNKPECTICEFILSALSKYVQQNSSAAEVEKLLEKICNVVMPSTIKQECADFVSEYGPTIIQLITNGFQPDKVCTLLKLCSPNQQQQSITSIHLTKDVKIPSEVYCDACQFTLQFLEYELGKDKSKLAITKALDNVCKIAPLSSRDHCNSIVETYGVYLIDLLEQSEPLAVCYRIKLCPHKVSEKPKETSIEAIELTPAKQVSNPQTKNDRLKLNIVKNVGDIKCSLCVYVAEILDNLLKQNKTDEEIKQELEKICNYFPGTLKDQCTSFLDEYVVYVLELLASDLDPQEVCQKLNFCPATNQVSKVDFRGLLKMFRDKIIHKNRN